MSQTETIKNYLTERKEPVHIDAIVVSTGIKKGSVQAVLSLGTKNGLFLKTGLNTFCINPNPLNKEVKQNDTNTI